MTRWILLCLIASVAHGQSSAPPPNLEIGLPRQVAIPRLASAQNVFWSNIIPANSGYLGILLRGNPDNSVTAVSVIIDAQGHPRYETLRTLLEAPTRWPLAAATDAGPILVWQSRGSILAATIDAAGSLANQHEIAADTALQALICNPTRCLVKVPSGEILTDGYGSRIRAFTDRFADFRRRRLSSDPDGFLLLGQTREGVWITQRIENNGAVFENPLTPALPMEAEVSDIDFDGSRHVVVWTESQNRSNSLWIAPLFVNGQLGERRRILDLYDDGAQLAWNGTEHLLVIHHAPPGSTCFAEEDVPCPSQLVGLRFDWALEPIDPKPWPISAPSASLVGPMATNDGEFYVGINYCPGTWGTCTPLGSRIVGGAVVTRDPLVLAPQPQSLRALVPLGDQHLVLWSDFDAGNNQMLLQSTRVPRVATARPQQPLQLNAGPYWFPAVGVSASASGSDVLVSWYNAVEDTFPPIYQGRRLLMRSDGSVSNVDPTTRPEEGGVAATGGNVHAWLAVHGGNAAQFIKHEDQKMGALPIRISSLWPESVDVASDGSNFLVALGDFPYYECNCGGAFISLVDGNGKLLLADRMLASPWGLGIRASWNGRQYLVVFSNNFNLIAQRISAAGDLIGKATIVDAQTPGAFALAALGDGWLIEWPQDGGRFAVRLNSEGTQVGPAFPLDAIALVSNRDDGSVTAASLIDVEFPPFGKVPVIVLRDLSWREIPRRRAVR